MVEKQDNISPSDQPTVSTLAIKFSNFFGGLGYLTCLLLWSWTLLILSPLLFENDRLKNIFLPNFEQTQTSMPSSNIILPNGVNMILSIIIFCLIVLATIIVIAKIPRAIANSGEKITAKATSTALPIVFPRVEKLPKSKRIYLTNTLNKIVKLIIATFPVVVSFVSYFIDSPIGGAAVIFISTCLSLITIFLFVLQYSTASLFRVSSADLI